VRLVPTGDEVTRPQFQELIQQILQEPHSIAGTGALHCEQVLVSGRTDEWVGGSVTGRYSER